MKAIEHCFKISFLGRFRWRVLSRTTIDCFIQDRIFRIGLLHMIEVGRAFEKMSALTTGVFGADGMAIDALCR